MFKILPVYILKISSVFNSNHNEFCDVAGCNCHQFSVLTSRYGWPAEIPGKKCLKNRNVNIIFFTAKKSKRTGQYCGSGIWPFPLIFPGFRFSSVWADPAIDVKIIY